MRRVVRGAVGLMLGIGVVGCSAQPALVTPIPYGGSQGASLTVSIKGAFATRQIVATASDIDQIVVTSSIGDTTFTKILTGDALAEGTASAAFVDLPSGQVTVLVEVLDAEGLVLGEASESATVLSGSATIVPVTITLIPTLS